ncbi:MAG: S24 family peptidase [Amphiplicatus sp.]
MDVETIKRLLQETGHTQRELAAHLEVDPAAITRLLRGERRLRLDEAPKVAAFFGRSQPGPAYQAPAPGSGAAFPAPAAESGARDLPVYASAQGGPDGMIIDYTPIEWIRRPPGLEGVVDAFAFYVVGDSMVPRFRHGERLLVHPRRPPRPGEDVLLILRDSLGDAANAMVKTLVARHDDRIVVAQYNPAKQFEVPIADVAELRLIVGNLFYG